MSRAFRAMFAVAASVLAACGASQPGRAEVVEQRLVYPRAPNGRSLSVPFVQASVGGRPVLALVDTGATLHFVTRTLAEERDLDLGPSELVVRDAYGAAPMQVFGTAAGVLRVGSLQAEPVFVIESENLRRAGISAVFSPRGWATEGRVVLIDGPRGVLRVSGAGERWRGGVALEFCPAGDDPRDGAYLVTEIAVGAVTARVVVDTGAEETVLLVYSDAAAPLLRAREVERDEAALRAVVGEQGAAPEPVTRVVLGVVTEGVSTSQPDVLVRVGGREMSATVATMPSLGTARDCGAVGVLGWDLLRRCRLAIEASGGGITCEEPVRSPPFASRTSAPLP